jgi:hypothetical protein
MSAEQRTMLATFKYSPLQRDQRWIRVLKLRPYTFQDNSLSVELEDYNIDEDSRSTTSLDLYALSYVWGDESSKRKIFCNGKVIEIGTNLYGALFSFSKQLKDSANIWADAICINQQDAEERNSQVLLMRDIYSRAKEVISYLGEADSDTAQLASILSEPPS